MAENILKLIEMIEKRNNPGLKETLTKIKNKLQPPNEEKEEPKPEIKEEKIENEKRVSFHVTYSREGKCWKVSLAGENKAISLKRTKKLAIDEAKKIANGFTKSQIVIHKKDGKIQREYTYGDDPKTYKG